ncbi:MAG TPA: mandelate racemase/muconate lactonizing enzyme family protein [Thermomicrobiales bacterium]|nr:mandelate racemase/muconate lactonizing enzyme family protein [Thermomicrobiales bacterium]
MKITSIEAEVVRTPYTSELRPAWSPGTVWQGSAATVYRVHTDEGITGIGASRGNPDVVRDIVSPLLTGRDPSFIEPIVRTVINAAGGYAAIPIACGIEMALWDLTGKVAGLPLSKLWGAHTDRVKAYASMVEVRTPEERADDALRLLDRGYRAIKLRLHSDTLREDIAQVEAVRKAVGDRMEIMVDANQAQEPGTPGAERSAFWGYDRALATARELFQLQVTWLEEPLPRYDFDNLRRLTAATDLPIAGGENNIGLHEFRALTDQECYDVLQPDALVCGGMSMLRKVAAYAEMHGRPVAPHHGGNGFGVATHLHLSASLANSPWIELLQDPPAMEAAEFQGLISTPLVPDADGYVHVPQGPGLGVELNERWNTAH